MKQYWCSKIETYSCLLLAVMWLPLVYTSYLRSNDMNLIIFYVLISTLWLIKFIFRVLKPRIQITIDQLIVQKTPFLVKIYILEQIIRVTEETKKFVKILYRDSNNNLTTEKIMIDLLNKKDRADFIGELMQITGSDNA